MAVFILLRAEYYFWPRFLLPFSFSVGPKINGANKNQNKEKYLAGKNLLSFKPAILTALILFRPFLF